MPGLWRDHEFAKETVKTPLSFLSVIKLIEIVLVVSFVYVD